MSTVLLTGGAGYIGSHTAVELLTAGYEVVIVDNLCNSSKEAVRRVEKITGKSVTFYEIDLRDKESLDPIFKEWPIDAVIHFAGLKAVGESVKRPLDYYENNVGGSIALFQVMQRHDVKKLIFSSSATVYGTPERLPIIESDRVGVGITNPYGETKFMIEQILRDMSIANPTLEITLLRYFNPVGAHESGLIGEDPNGVPNNLLPYISQVAIGKLDKVSVFGNDYETPDGTGVRDYIHVTDLAKGHLAALKHSKKGAEAYNLCTGTGTSVLELIAAFKQASGKDIPYQVVERRPGDVATCFASPEKANHMLEWFTEKTIQEACNDSWRWQSQNPNGYSS